MSELEGEEFAECPVCLERMEDIAFPCSDINDPCPHGFCMPCMQSLHTTARAKSQPLNCPLCRRTITGFMRNPFASRMAHELDKAKNQLRDTKEREKEIHKRERRFAMDNSNMSIRIAQLEGELAKTASDQQCEADRNEHLKKMFTLMEMEKEALAERLQDLQRKLQTELEESSRRIGNMENEVSEYQNQLRIAAEDTAKAEDDKKELQIKIKDMEARLGKAYEERRAVEMRVAELEDEMARAAAEFKRAQAEHEASLDDVRARLQVDARKAQMEHEAMAADLRARLQAAGAVERRCRELELKVSFLEGEVKRAREETARAERRTHEMEVSARKTEAERAGAGQVVSQLETMLGQYKEETKILEREKYECTKKAAELEGILAKMKSDTQKWEDEKHTMKERVWKAERDLEVMRQERDKMRLTMKEKDGRLGGSQDTYLSGLMRGLKPFSNAIWGEQKVCGPLVKNMSDYFILERRGSRKDSRVWRCKSRSFGVHYALKSLLHVIPQNSQGTTDLTAFREAMLLRTMEHPNIIRLEGLFHDKGSLNLLLSPFVEFDLDYSIGQKSMNASEIKNLMYQLLLAVSYMHSQDLVHRNIKPTNILRFEDYTLKLCGFTYARSVHNNHTLDMIVPKPPMWYCAPEIFLAQASSKAQNLLDWKAADIWAIGCVFAEMLLQTPLFSGPPSADPLTNILSILDLRPKDMSALKGMNVHPPNTPGQTLSSVVAKSPYATHPSFRPACALLRDLLVFESPNRITAANALQHEYFQEFAAQPEPKGKDIANEVTDSCLPQFVEFYCSGIL